MLKFEKVDFHKSISINNNEVFFEENSEIIFVGRSNVGKSTLMNTLFWKKDLVKTSSKPWKTRLANQFLVDKKYFFTDLPGYWFAKMWKNLKADLDALISWYIEERKAYLKSVVILIDSRLWAQQSDIDMFKYLDDLGIPLMIVLSKTDKLSKNDIFKSKMHAEKQFFGQQIFAVSATKKDGMKELVSACKKVLQ
jgi:GTP-binding protein